VKAGGVSAADAEPTAEDANVGESAASPFAARAAARAAAAARNLAFASSADVCGGPLGACFSLCSLRAASSFWRARRRSFSETASAGAFELSAGAFFSSERSLDAASFAAACSSAWRLAASARAASARSRCFSGARRDAP
jgi:hypothetical protein